MSKKNLTKLLTQVAKWKIVTLALIFNSITLLDTKRLNNIERKIEDINLKLLDFDIVETLKHKLQSGLGTELTNKDVPSMEEYFILYQNLEKKLHRKIDTIAEKTNIHSDTLSQLTNNFKNLETSVELLSIQEKYILETNQKHKRYMDLLKHNFTEGFEEIKEYCDKTYSK